MKENEKKIIGIGVGVGVVILAILAMTGFFRSDNEEDPSTVESRTEETVSSEAPTQITEDSTQESLLEEILGEEKTEESTPESLEVIPESDVDNAYIEWQQKSEYEREMKKVNESFITAYYGNLEPKERNAKLKELVTESVFEEEEIPESGQVFQPFIEDLEIESIVKTVDKIQGTVVNILSMKVDHVPQKMLVTVSMVQSDGWIIDQIGFEVILSNQE
ncbi:MULTISPECIES: hypothetical protein [unclassified Enterococcus]|uniref:hypothetical protein n=1 Tax=unclassified Enterococcus TaxID=2608891 RepID=UPI0019035612|nr:MULTISPECIES: hypothetical protein [unclassified Enterococcus]MBK0039334.1 hypothetical protein [Enterococcus sp. S52]MBK0071981.1 hypothetical protein [Enterococcus sp. S53]MBK0142572.1 hypothetical protein [Enterococcus sp. S76]MBK0146140.1 hypothetical protein [Enterococcus sp. S77]